MKSRIPALFAALSLLMILSLGVSWVAPSSAIAAETAPSDEQGPTKDLIVLRSGTVVEGQILEESGGVVKIEIVVSGIKATTTYRMSEILEIQRDIPVVTDIPGSRNPEADDPDAGWGDRDDAPAADSGDKPKVYRFPLKGHIVGEFRSVLNYLLQSNRRDIISYTPVEKTMRDALSYDPDVIIVEMDADAPSTIGWDGGIVTVPLLPIFQEVIDDPDVRLVFWIKDANFGAAFLPFICPEIYFESDGTLGGIGTLDDFDIGDELVNAKQISLRIVTEEGVAIKNGYDPAIIRGLARKSNWLCYRFRHGKVEFLEHEPREIDGDGWVILTDDGKGEFKDKMKTRGNDVLNINAKMAKDIELSKGTFDKIDDLVFSLGIRGDYDLIEGRAKRNFSEWRDRVEIGIDRYVELNRDIENLGSGNRNQSAISLLGRQRRLLRELRGLLTTYEEVFDPTGQQRAGIDIELEKLREQLLQASAAERKKNQRSVGRSKQRR